MFHQLSVLKEKISKSSLNQKTRSENLVFITIPAAGVEPARPCGHWILSPIKSRYYHTLVSIEIKEIDQWLTK